MSHQVNLHLGAAHFAHLERMAAEAGVKPGALARRMFEALLDEDAKAHQQQMGGDLMRAFTEDQIRQHLPKLKGHYAKIIDVCDLQKLEYEKAAEQPGVPVGTVKSRLHRARAALGEIVDREAAPQQAA